MMTTDELTARLEENNRQLVELEKIIAAGPASAPKVRTAKRLIKDLIEDSQMINMRLGTKSGRRA